MAEPQYDYYHQRKNAPSTSKILAISTVVPFGASLLIFAFLTLTVTIIGLAVSAPLLVFFSPVLVPAALVIGFAVAGFLTSGACGITSLSSFAWMASYLRRSRLPEQLQCVKDRAQETLGDLAHRTKEAAETGISKAQEMAQSTTHEVGKAQ
ncbi:putative oleosin [Lupinus albus]|uniref:Putative oleosin n=1 Tax=Lupinus albus TaxID=3870 RepID=A0A6A4Q843_LUPAL|nr:putative oleosin [Lupinus albus]